jgi:hypothetical protein
MTADEDTPSGSVRADKISLREVKAWHREAVNAEELYRERIEDDWRVFHGDPWTEQQKEVLKKRKQIPLNLDHISRDVLTQLGRQISNRMRPTAKPRANGDSNLARGLTDVMAYYLDVNRFDFEQSQTILDQLVARGWLCYRYQREDITREHIQIEYTPWYEIKVDPKTRRRDLDDCAYLFRERWVTLSDAQAMYPDKARLLANDVSRMVDGNQDVTNDKAVHPNDGYRDAFDGMSGGRSVGYVTKDRKRVRIVECWFRRSSEAWQIRWGNGEKELLDPENQQQAQKLQADPKAQIVKGPVRAMYYVIFAGNTILRQGPSPYKHGMFPYVPYWAFMADMKEATSDLAPGEPYGMIRKAKDKQRAKNQAASKALHIFNTTGGTYLKGAVNVEDLRENASKPDGWIAVTQQDAVQPWDKSAQASALVQMMEIFDTNVEASTGINEASRGVGPEQSGRALFARQQQSETINAILVDNQRLALQMGGWILVSMIQQSVTAEKVVRITEDVGDRLVAVNVTDEARRLELEAEGVEVYGSLSEIGVDIKVDEAPADMARQEADYQLLQSLIQQLGPVGAMGLADLVVEMTATRNKEKLMERISQIQQMQGMGGPQQPDPAAVEAQQAMLGAEVATKQAGAAKAEAEAMKAHAEAQETQQRAEFGGQRNELDMAMQMEGHAQKLRHGDEMHQQRIQGMGRPA